MAFQFTQTAQELQDLADTAEKIAAEYDETASWTTGDYCTHEGTIYRCTASTTGTFDASSWTAVILCDELEGLRTRMSTAEGNIQTNANDITALNLSLAKRASVRVTIPVGTTTGPYNCGTLSSLFGVANLDQTNVISVFGFVVGGNTQTVGNMMPVMVYNNNLYINVQQNVDAATKTCTVGLVIQYLLS